MKKLLILFALLYPFNANAANLTDTIGAECGRILLALREGLYPNNYEVAKTRNAQFKALSECLDVYKKTGGDYDELNKRFFRAYYLFGNNIVDCIIDKNEKCYNIAWVKFQGDLIRNSNEMYDFYKDNDKVAPTIKQWVDVDEIILNNKMKLQEDKKGFFSWFK